MICYRVRPGFKGSFINGIKSAGDSSERNTPHNIKAITSTIRPSHQRTDARSAFLKVEE
jgi:hypothetical protein